MNDMRFLSLVVVSAALLSGCTSSSSGYNGRYSGSGGALFGTPSDVDIKSGRANYDEERFSNFKIGKTTKREVINQLGKPAYWKTREDGSSRLMYQYVESSSAYMPGIREVVDVHFLFNSDGMLMEIKLPED